jgi:hypothetical protein
VGKDKLEKFQVMNFFDEYLMSTTGRTGSRMLMQAAFDRYYIQNERLRGLHSLIFIDEVALVSLPDIVHSAWQPNLDPTPDPFKASKPRPYDGSQFLICQGPPLVDRVLPAQGYTLGGTQVTIRGKGFTTNEQTGVAFGGQAAGSVIVDSETSLTCIAPPNSHAESVDVTVSNWFGTASKNDAFTYLMPPQEQLPLLALEENYDESVLRQAQKNLIEFCLARQDVMAILSLPAHYSKEACLTWQENLRQDFNLPPRRSYVVDIREIVDLSYAAIYHPWHIIADLSAPDGLRAVPPDGAICGQIAFRERQRQVWVAPANQPLQGILGLLQEIPAPDKAELFDRQFNLVDYQALEFRPLSAQTLGDDPSLMQISVRRLMILLRKIAHNRGMDYVFESNDERFQASVQFALEETLQSMYERGALAGASPQQAYRVSTNASLNIRQSVEQGRFIAQIQVAPSQPMEFITILLLRVGDGMLQTIES